jgi:polyhydroxyalkanoate synthesis regulator phasin
MSDEPESVAADDFSWPENYFNYFTEIEEHFQRARGTSLFLLSPLDWALIESWKNAGVPLEAVLRGIDDAFDKWRSRKRKTRMVNSLAYCTQAVLEAAKQMAGTGTSRTLKKTESPFAVEELRQYIGEAATKIRAHNSAPFVSVAESLEAIAAGMDALVGDLEDLERRLTALEEKLVAAARSALPDDDLLAIRRDLDSELNPFRGKMTADQISMLERRYLDTAVLQRSDLPRLSLFYIH